MSEALRRLTGYFSKASEEVQKSLQSRWNKMEQLAENELVGHLVTWDTARCGYYTWSCSEGSMVLPEIHTAGNDFFMAIAGMCVCDNLCQYV